MVCLTTSNLNNLLAYVQPLLTLPLDVLAHYFFSKLKHKVYSQNILPSKKNSNN